MKKIEKISNIVSDLLLEVGVGQIVKSKKPVDMDPDEYVFKQLIRIKEIIEPKLVKKPVNDDTHLRKCWPCGEIWRPTMLKSGRLKMGYRKCPACHGYDTKEV